MINSPISGNNVDATRNWWGTTNANTIANKVYDYADDPTKAIAALSPVLTEANNYDNTLDLSGRI